MPVVIRSGNIVQKSDNSSRTVSLPQSTEYTYPGMVVQYNTGGGTFIPVVDTNSIVYTVGDRHNIGKANYCIHRRRSANYAFEGAIDLLHDSVAAPTRLYRFRDYGFRVRDAHTAAEVAAKAAFGTQVDESLLGANGYSYILDGFNRMRPDLTEVSVPNFLLDFSQIQSLLKIWSPRRSLLKNAANAHLNYSFGWAPTISDVRHMISAVRDLQLKIRKWNASLGQVLSKRCTLLNRTISKSGSLVNVPTSLGTTTWSGNLIQTVTAHIRYKPLPIAVMSNTERLLRGYLDSLGFELNPAIIWDKIPFSFVVDWFINIGGLLESLKLDTLELPIALEDSFLQYKQKLEVNSAAAYTADVNWPAWKLPGARSSEVFFQRMLVQPKFEDFLQLGWRTPKLKQWLLGLSLTITKSKIR